MLKSALIVACTLGVVLLPQEALSLARYRAGTVPALPVMALGGGQVHSATRGYMLMAPSELARTLSAAADRIVARVVARVSAGDIIVLHDGDESAPRKDQHQTVDATAQLIAALRARGFDFGTVCQNGG